jgi:hypothetical protein
LRRTECGGIEGEDTEAAANWIASPAFSATVGPVGAWTARGGPYLEILLRNQVIGGAAKTVEVVGTRAIPPRTSGE